MNPDEPGPSTAAIYAALAKAQGEFPAIPRDKEVTVRTKSGGEYKFKYAPLDSILNAVRPTLASNGLAIAQTLDGGDLVTMLLHKDGGFISGRSPIGDVDGGVQAYGSAVTYLRRYSIQAILGIAAEEDDDGNTAATFRPRVDHEKAAEADGLIGIAVTHGTQDGELRQTPEGFILPFRVKDGDRSFIVMAHDTLAETLGSLRGTWMGSRVTVWGTWTDETLPKKGNRPEVKYRILHLDRIQTPEFVLPAHEAPTEELGL